MDCDDIDDFDDDFEDFDDDFDDDSDDDDVDAEPLQITSVDFPGSVVSGAPAAPLTVTWSGDAVSPLTLTYRPRSCEGGFTCFTVTDTFDDPGSTLVFVDAVFCFGFSETVFFDYEVVLSDASGQRRRPSPLASPACPIRRREGSGSRTPSAHVLDWASWGGLVAPLFAMS